MKKPVIAVLFGGCSSEYAISLQSAHGCSPIWIGRSTRSCPWASPGRARWFQYAGGLDAIPADTWHQTPPTAPRR